MEHNPLEDLLEQETTPGGHVIEKNTDPAVDRLRRVANELKNKDLFVDGEKWKFGEMFADGRVLIRRVGAAENEPAATREKMLTADEFQKQVMVTDRGH